MTATELYKKILLQVNLNDTSGNIYVPKSTAVIIFNQEALKWLDKEIEDLLASDEINEIKEFLISDINLEKIESKKDSTDFKLPDDFFEYSRSYSIASKGDCKGRVLYNQDVKNKNLNLFLSDANNRPSFEYEETLIKLTNNKLKVYKEDFEIDEQYLDYYKTPKLIDIEGYIKFDGTPSTNIDPDFSDFLVDRVIKRVAIELLANQQNTEALQNRRLKESVQS